MLKEEEIPPGYSFRKMDHHWSAVEMLNAQLHLNALQPIAQLKPTFIPIQSKEIFSVTM